MTDEEFEFLRDRIVTGLRKVPEKVAELKRQKGTLVVIWKDGEIVKLSPDEYLREIEESRKTKINGEGQ